MQIVLDSTLEVEQQISNIELFLRQFFRLLGQRFSGEIPGLFETLQKHHSSDHERHSIRVSGTITMRHQIEQASEREEIFFVAHLLWKMGLHCS